MRQDSASPSGHGPLHPDFPILAAARPLEALAADINQAHQEAQQYASQAVERALQAGDLLLTVKARLAHGEFGNWCKANLPSISARQLQRYMKVARELPAEKRHESYLSLNEALRVVSEEPERPPRPAERGTTLTERMSARLAEAERLRITADDDFLFFVKTGMAFPEPGERVWFDGPNDWRFELSYATADGPRTYFYVWAMRESPAEGCAVNYLARAMQATACLLFMREAGVAGLVAVHREPDCGFQGKAIEEWHRESWRPGHARIAPTWETAQ